MIVQFRNKENSFFSEANLDCNPFKKGDVINITIDNDSDSFYHTYLLHKHRSQTKKPYKNRAFIVNVSTSYFLFVNLTTSDNTGTQNEQYIVHQSLCYN